MYNLNGINLNLNETMLKSYSELIGAELNSEHFNDSIGWLAEMMLKTDSFEKAIELYGPETVSKKIEKAIQNELSLYDVDNTIEID